MSEIILMFGTYCLGLYIMCRVMAMRTDFALWDHYFDRLQEALRAEDQRYCAGEIDAYELLNRNDMLYSAYLNHRRAVYGF